MADGTPSERHVRIYEVGPRDGLQNEARPVATADKLRFIELLAASRPDRDRGDQLRPPVGDSPAGRCRRAGPLALGLSGPGRDPLPRPRPERARPGPGRGRRGRRPGRLHGGLERLHRAQHRDVDRRIPGRLPARSSSGPAAWAGGGGPTSRPRSAVPTSGRSRPAAAIEVALRLRDLGADEICFGDTIGVAVPDQVEELTGQALAAGLERDRIAFHFHDTRGTALANVAAGLRSGIRTLRRRDRRDGRLPLRAGRGRQPGHRGPRLLPRRVGLEPWRRAGRGPRRGALHRRGPGPAARLEGRPGRRLGPGDRRRLRAALIASAPWTVPSSS